MKTTDVSVCLDLLHNILIGPASGVESLQTKIRSVVNETAKQPKLSLPWLPVSSLLVDLLEHIADQGAKPDTLLLAGTCVVRILCRFLTLDAASDAVRQLLATPSRDSALKLCHNAFLPSPSLPSPSVNALNSPTFYHLCLIHGILSAGPDMHSLLTCQRDGTADPLITEVLRPLVGLVHDDSISRYHSVSTLHLWFKTLEQLLGKSESEEDGEAFPVGSLGKSLLTPESDATSLVLSAVDANWESSANGVSDLIRKIYQSFLNVTHSQCSIENSSAKLEVELLHIGPFHKYLLERTMQLDWKEKPKYLSLACLLQFVPFESCLKIDADFTKHCIRGLLANHLVSATVDVYRASLTFGSTRRASKEMWSLYWKVPVVDIIRCDDGTCLQNMTTHLLPWTLKNIPGSLEELADSFKTHGSDDISLSFLATLGRIGLQAGLTSRVLKEPLMAKCLVHQSNAIRIETFSLCCSSYILNAGKPEAEMSKIVQFVMANLNVDDSWFRSRLLVQFENVLLALRESIVSEFNRETRQKKRGSRKSAGQSHYTSAFCFVKEIVVLAVENLFSGANYQRAITSLSVLECVANIFRVDPSGKQRSTHKREILEKFFASETSRFELGPMQKRIRSAFLKALFHNVLEVRLSAFRLLTTHGCPLFESGSSLQDVLQDTADKYLASPRPQDNAVGALLLHLYLTNLKEEPKQLAAKLEEICSLGENSFSEFQRDPVSASASFPLHGLLLTLVTCLSDVKCILAAVQSCSANGKNRDLICGTLTRALCLARSSLFHSLFVMVPKEKQRTLGAMSANSADRVAPSFEDTNLAFTELIRGHEMAERIRFTPEQRQQVEERLASFCWHCIKNSCSLLDLVASISLKDNGISYSLDSRSLHDIVDALVAVMTGCRHRGAIESCCESLKSLCQVLSSCETTEISDIPFNFVKKALSSLTSRSKSSSVTRRSAGLPLLIRALLEGEARNVKRSMSWTVDHLSSVIRECAEQGGNSACTVDLPQAEALHVLCAVVGSASLTAAVMMHLGRILWFCFEGLASPFWLVRNAAHQLYGATAPRVLGLKKTREEFVGHDAMTALDLFAKFPDLRDFFLKKLDGSNVNNHDLYFVLDFLSRLKPPAIGQQGIKSLVPFQQCIRNHLGCRSWKLCLLAAKCVSSFCRRTKKEVMLLLGNVATLKGARSHNSAHAHLYAVNRLLTNNTVCVPDIAKWFQESGSLSRLSWTLSSNFFVRMEFLDLLDLLSVNGDNTESQEKLQKSFLLDIADTARLEKLPGSVAWRQKQTQWFLRRAACLCPAEIVGVVQKGKECDVVMETALEFLNPQALRPDCGITPDLWCEVAVALVRFLNGTSGLPDQSADVLDLLGVLLNKREVANKCVNPALLATFQCISVEKSSVAGTTVRALSLVVWSHCLKHCLQNPDCYSPEVERSAESWTSAITSAVSNREKLAATADVRRMHAARSLRVAGDSVFAWAAWKCKPRKSKLLQSLFSATLALLQDEDPQVRSEAAGALPLRSDGPQSLPVQPNIAADNLFKKLVLAFEGDTAQLVKFLWRELCRSGPSALCEFQQLTKPTVASLFEQDESGVFMEPMVVSHMLHRGTQMALEGALQGSTDLMSFLLDEALRLADELMAASQAIGEFTLLTDKPLGTNLEILARPKLHHGIAVLRARADLVEWACAHFIAEPRPGATAETLRPGKEVGELSLLPNAAFQLSHVKACFVELWTRLTFE